MDNKSPSELKKIKNEKFDLGGMYQNAWAVQRYWSELSNKYFWA